MPANDIQHGGQHYKDLAIQPWDYCELNELGCLQSFIVKYVTRFRSKGGIEDLLKAKHCLDKLIENESEKKQQARTSK